MAFDSKLLAALTLALVTGACTGNGSRTRTDAGADELPDLSPVMALPDFDFIPDLKMPRNPDAACAAAKAPGMPAKRPIDLIVVVDNSGSMRNKIKGVEAQINTNLTDVLEKSGIDYRVIVISLFGYWMDNKICPAPPLSNNVCNKLPIIGPPKNTPRYFHFDYDIQSTDPYLKLIESYNKRDNYNLAPNGWGSWLRQGANKAFLFVTDDNSVLSAAQFDFQMRALDPIQFGTDKKRNFVVHAIVGMKGNGMNTPWGPRDPVQATKCGVDAENNSEEHQNLAILTGGLRFPICDWADYSPMFRAVTTGVIDGTKLACELLMPEPPLKPGGMERETIDYESVVVQYSSPLTAGLVVEFKQVMSAGACGADSFYLSEKKDRVLLCPQTCARVQADKDAKMDIVYDCVYFGG